MYPILAIISDIHVDLFTKDYLFDYYFNKEEHKEMILCIAGDIVTDTKPHVSEFKDYLLNVKKYFKHVVWVAGNHDLWGYNILGENTFDDQIINLNLDEHRIHYLRFDDTTVIDDIEFWGHTFWSKIEDPLAQIQIQSLKDYSNIFSDYNEPLSVYHTNLVNDRARSALNTFLNSPRDNQSYGANKRVVMTHFPLFRNKVPEYPNVFDIYYDNHMDYELVYLPQPDLYIFGHTHTPFDFDFMGARAICNPRGYPSQSPVPGIFEMKYVDFNNKSEYENSK